MSTYNPIPSLTSVEDSFEPSFSKMEETNIRVRPGEHYQFGYGADLKKVYLADKVKLVGIMFCHPHSKIGEDDVIPRLEYLHYRSGEDTDLFWGGYGPFMEEFVPLGVERIKVVAGIVWGFSEEGFNSFRAEIEAVTAWKNSGEHCLRRQGGR